MEKRKSIFTVILCNILLASCCAAPQESVPSFQGYAIKAVFIGNSITEIWSWDHPEFFSRNRYVNVGIGGQTTWQMLQRFQVDVVEKEPQCVVIMGGINDIARNPSFSPTLEGIKNNIRSMVKKAQAAGIVAIVCSTPPAQNVNWNVPVPDATQQVVDLNAMLSDYAKNNDVPYIDIHSVLKDNNNKLKAQYCRGAGDSVHLSSCAYSIIEPIIKHTIDSLLIVKH